MSIQIGNPRVILKDLPLIRDAGVLMLTEWTEAGLLIEAEDFLGTVVLDWPGDTQTDPRPAGG